MKASFGPTGAVFGGSTSPGAMVKVGPKIAYGIILIAAVVALCASGERGPSTQLLRMWAYMTRLQWWDEIAIILKRKVYMHG